MDAERDILVLRELVKQLLEVCERDVQRERRELWRRHNSLEHMRPPVLVRYGCCEWEIIQPLLVCRDPFFREHEHRLRSLILQDGIGDDYVFEPWITQRASVILPDGGPWGVAWNIVWSGQAGKGYHCNPALIRLDDMERLVTPCHRIDEQKTIRNFDRITEAVGDLIEVNMDRSPHWSNIQADISTDLGYLRGHENMMLDIIDWPDELHRLLAFMRDGILKAQEEAEIAGDWNLTGHFNQSMPYVRTLRDPKANSGPVSRKELWIYMAAQEMTAVSPAHHDEFMLNYQIPVMEKFGLAAYGCCEDLSRKIDILRKVRNLRRIAVTPFADVQACAEQIGIDYVCSYRPNPALMVCYGFDEKKAKAILKKDLAIFKKFDCVVDICLKDVQTVQGDPGRLAQFAKIARAASEEY